MILSRCNFVLKKFSDLTQMALKTWSIVYRNRGSCMPITDDVIEYIYDKAEVNVLSDYDD